MAIHGTLRRNPLSAILQKLSHADATGQLQVLSDVEAGQKLRIDFRHGNIVFVKSGLRPPDMRLGQLVIRGGYATEQDVWGCLTAADQTHAALGTVLLNEGLVEIDVISELLGVQFFEDLVFGLSWTKGDFRFVEDDPKVRDAEPALSPKSFLTEALRYKDKKKVFAKIIPDGNAVFMRAVPTPLPEADIVANKLTIEDVALFEVLDGTLSVSHLLPVMRQPLFEVAQTIRRLSESGLIQRTELRGATETRVQVRRRSWGQSMVFHGLTTFVIIGILALSVGLFLTYRGSHDVAEAIRPIDPRHAALTRTQTQRIRHGLETYYSANGVYPSSLSVLVEDETLTPADLTFPDYARPYVYLPSGDTFVLVRPKR